MPACFFIAWFVTLFGSSPVDEADALVEKWKVHFPPPLERVEMALQLGKCEGPKVDAFLLERFGEETEVVVRRALLDALVARSGRIDAKLLKQAVFDRDAYIRARSLSSLESISPSDGVHRARDVIRFDEDGRVRQLAIGVLTRLGATEDLSFLLESCGDLPLEEQRVLVITLAKLPHERLALVLAPDSVTWNIDNPARRLLGTLVLSARADESEKERLTDLSKDKDRTVAAAAALGLDRIEGKGRGMKIAQALARARDPDERLAILDVLGRIGLDDEGLTKALEKELRSVDWRLRGAAAEALAGASGDAAVVPLVELLDREKILPVRVAAIRALSLSRSLAAIEPLIKVLETKSGREAHEAHRALTMLTGQSLGRYASAWRRFWQDRRDSFVLPIPEVAMWTDATPSTPAYSFYGLEVPSEQVAFVLDTSGSMQGEPIATLKRELEHVIGGLPDGALFNMVFFSSGIASWQPRMVEVDGKTRRAALESVRYIDADGATNMWGGLESALADDRVDSIFLLSDGQPTAGEIKDTRAITSNLREINRHRRIAFHVVLIGYSSREWERFAKESGGTYIETKS